MSFAENFAQIQERMHDAARRAGRSPEEVRLIAVSKTKPVSQLEEAIAAGQRVFGENRVQEALEKREALRSVPEVEWHLIGHLQKNKAKFCPGNFQWVHSIDSEDLARRLHERTAAWAAASELPAEESLLNVLIQLNISDEESKSGLQEDAALRSLAEFIATSCPSLRLRGLMCIPAPDLGELRTRQAFAQVREALEQLRSQLGPEGLTELSMGMTADFEWAVLEGSTMVRVGSALFGAR